MKNYGILVLWGRYILGYINDDENFLTKKLLARESFWTKKRDLEYGEYTLKNNFIVLNHDEGDGEVDLIMDIISGNVYWWEYRKNNYYSYNPQFLKECNSFIDFLIDSLLSEIESDEIDIDSFIEENNLKIY